MFQVLFTTYSIIALIIAVVAKYYEDEEEFQRWMDVNSNFDYNLAILLVATLWPFILTSVLFKKR